MAAYGDQSGHLIPKEDMVVGARGNAKRAYEILEAPYCRVCGLLLPVSVILRGGELGCRRCLPSSISSVSLSVRVVDGVGKLSKRVIWLPPFQVDHRS